MHGVSQSSSTLIDAPQLLAWPRDRPLVLVDCRFDLADPGAGELAYAAGHLPDALYAHLERDLAGPVSAHSGRHPLPDAAALARRFGEWGLARNVQLVAYDAGSGAYAARLWWLARWLGHETAAVLNGGLDAWLAAGGRLVTEVALPAAREFVARRDDTRWVDSAAVESALRDASGVVIDARAPERYAGIVEPIDAVAGHVPGALSAPFAANLGADGRFLPRAALAARYAPLLAGRPARELIIMCGSGVTACHDLLALEVAGLTGARLYAGSWSEWIRDPSRPIARGCG